jgi:Ni,Fe-hydrogenase III small subunit
MNSQSRSSIKKEPQSALGILWHSFTMTFSHQRRSFDHVTTPELPKELTRVRRPVFIRHLDCGSCNGCELELNALFNPVYDIEQYGICFEASPRHATDFLAMTGPFTFNLAEAADLTLDATPGAKIIAVGDCAIDGGPFKESYGIVPRVEPVASRGAAAKAETTLVKFKEETVIEIPGCPPAPEDILKALLGWSVSSPKH